jgi:hypothetical protein
MDHIVLGPGNHTTRAQGVCLMEAVAWFAGESHSAAPQCACPVLAAFGRRLNDRLDQAHRQELKDLIPALALSRGSRAVTVRRGYVAADFAVRRFAPHALELRGVGQPAARLRALAPVVDQATAAAARKEARAAAYAAAAASAAAAATAAAAAAADAAADAAATAAAAYAAADADGKKQQDWLLREGRACLEAMLAVTE